MAHSTVRKRRFALILALAASACGGPYTVLAVAGGSRVASAPLPHLIITMPGTVLRSGGSQRLRVAVPRARLPLEVLESSSDGSDVLVRLVGGIEIRGVVRRDEIGVLVCAAGPLGERGYAGAGNALGLRSGVEGAAVRVRADVSLAGSDGVPGRRLPQRQIEAPIDLARLCTALPPPRHAGTSADPHVGHVDGEIDSEDFPPGTEVIDVPKEVTLTLLDRPGGTAVYTRPADRWGYEVARLRHEGGWDLLAVGGGPYLVGWIPARPVREHDPTGGLGMVGGLVGSSGNGPFSLHTRALSRLPLHELPVGTVVQQFGIPIGRLVRPGFARVGELRDGWQYVVAAVDDDVVIEGWVEPAKIGRKVQ